ncbi:MAG: DnaB-like helicase C-terminal domain-containing protein [Acidobacteriota bacterium]
MHEPSPSPVPVLGQILPHSEEAERAVCAAVLLRPGLLEDLDLRPSDFYLERHRHVFRAYLRLAERGDPIDLRTLQAHLEQHGLFEQVGGMAYLAGLDLDLPDLGRSRTYADIVRERSLRRRLISAAQRIAQDALTAPEDAAELLAQTRRSVEGLEGMGGESRSRLAGDVAARVLETARARREQRLETGSTLAGLPTGLPSLDRMILGLDTGLHLLAGPPGMGKTTLAMQIALHVARTTPVVYVSYENTAESLVLRALCSRARIDSQDVRRGRADPEPLEKAAAELAPQLERLTVVDGQPQLSLGRVRSIARSALGKHAAAGPRVLIVIDYLQLMAKVARDYRSLSDTRARVDALGGELITLAKQLQAPIVALSSQSRAAGAYGSGGGKATLDSLKESGDLEYAADAALFLTENRERQVPAPAKLVTLTVSKNRHGPTGEVPLVFLQDQGLFREEDRTRL